MRSYTSPSIDATPVDIILATEEYFRPGKTSQVRSRPNACWASSGALWAWWWRGHKVVNTAYCCCREASVLGMQLAQPGSILGRQ